jgi:hypothetical protein
MRKLAVITGAALAIASTWTAIAGQNNDISTQPQANAYVSMAFGHSQQAASAVAPLHYGLRMAYDQRLRSFSGDALPALAQWDFDSRGNRIAMVGGIPFMAHIKPPMRQADDQAEGQTNGQAPQGIGPEGLNFFDLSLLVGGVAAIGYLIYEVADNKDSPTPAPGTTGGTTGGLLGGTTGGLLGGVLGYTRTGELSADRDLERQAWLDGGSGHMGDLQSR